MSEEIKKRDERDNVIYYKTSKGNEYWYEYDEHSRIIHYKGINKNVNKNGEKIESWYKYDKYENRAIATKQEFERIKEEKEQKEFLSRKEISRFELIEL